MLKIWQRSFRKLTLTSQINDISMSAFLVYQIQLAAVPNNFDKKMMENIQAMSSKRITIVNVEKSQTREKKNNNIYLS